MDNLNLDKIAHLEVIAELSKETRRLQKIYFRLRTPGALRESKAAESKLDKALEQLDAPEFKNLFNR